MGNICSACQKKQQPKNKERDLLISPTGNQQSPNFGDVWDDEDWFDALQDHDDLEPNFEVSLEELDILRAELQMEFPNDCHYFSDDYILSVASKPYSKNMSIRRPLEYSMEKLTHVMEWRQQAQAPQMPEWVKLANGPESQCRDKDLLQKAKLMVKSLNTASMYWHGLTKDGRPILWIRTNRKHWYPNVAAEVQALICMADVGIAGMPMGVTDFVCISHSHKPPPPNPPFAYQMLRGLVKGYPDRLNVLISAPVSSIVEFCMNLLLPLMPGRMHQKFQFFSLDHVQEKLQELLLHGAEDIPTFLGGPVDHNIWYPEAKYAKNQGQGNLTFDFYGMVERLKEQVKEYEQMKGTVSE